MGINESRDMFFKRRQNEFLDVLLTSFEWMDEFIEDIYNFEDYLKLILRHSIDGFFEFNDTLVTSDEIEELLPLAFLSLRNDKRLFRKIKEHYDSKKYPTRYESEDINESNEINRVKRRLGRLIKHIRSQYSNLAASRFDNFDHFLRRLVHDTTMHIAMDLFDSEDFDDMSKMMDDFEPKMLNYIKTNKEMYDEIHNYFFSEGGWGDPNESSFEKVNRLNEFNEINRVKRRMDALLDYIEHSYDWLSPRAFTDFDHFLKRVVFSAARDFVVDEIGGEYEDQLKIREELEPMILELIKKHSIYDEIYDHYISNI
jgi:hypothetical protein